MGKSRGGLAPDSLVEDEAAVLEDMRRLIKQYHDPGRLVSSGIRYSQRQLRPQHVLH